jgi:ABC-2 type transport system permease protein
MTLLTGTSHLLRLASRRDRVTLPVWVVSIGALVLLSASAVVNLYTTGAELETYARLIRGNAAMIVQSGPGHGLDDPTVGAVLANESLLWAVIGAGLMSTFLVSRHTRAEEETGRAELLRAGVVGRRAAGGATLLLAGVANAAIGGVLFVGLVLLGLPGAGAAAYGAAVATGGAAFAGIALLAAQVFASARGVIGAGVTAVAVAFVLRAIGDVGDGRLSWLSPIGWAQAVRPWADERWWVLAVPVSVTLVFTVVAVILADHRDFGSGLVTTRPGPAAAAGWLSSPLGLALRQQRGSIIGWTVGLFLLGLFYGIVGDEADELFADNPELQDFFAQLGQADLTDAFFATALLMLALIGSGFVVGSTLALRREETSGRAEPVLATPTGRPRWAWSHLAVTVIGTVLVLGVAGAGAGLGYGAVTGEVDQVWRLTGAMLALVPSALVLAGVTALLFGVAPRATPLAWIALAVVVVDGVLGDLLGLPRWLRLVSPFQHAPSLPAEELRVLPLLVLLVVAAALLAAGVAAYGRRDAA